MIFYNGPVGLEEIAKWFQEVELNDKDSEFNDFIKKLSTCETTRIEFGTELEDCVSYGDWHKNDAAIFKQKYKLMAQAYIEQSKALVLLENSLFKKSYK